MQHYSSKDAGSGAIGIALYVFGFGILWFVSYFIIGWIYDTKEARIDRAWAAAHPKNVQVRVINPDPGNYLVRCSGFLSKTCKKVD